MTRLLNFLGVITVIAAIVIGLLQLDLPQSGRIAVISVNATAFIDTAVRGPACGRHGMCMPRFGCAAYVQQMWPVLTGTLCGRCLVWHLSAGHSSSWSVQFQGLPSGGSKPATGPHHCPAAY